MGIRKWMTHTRKTILRLHGAHAAKLSLCAVLCLCAHRSSNAEWTVETRLIPGYYIPMGDTLFQNSFGGAAVFDASPFKNLSFFVQGEYVSLSLESLNPVPLSDGSLGLGVKLRPHDRLSVRGDIMGGVYSATMESGDLSGISAGVRLGTDYHISPALKASISASARHWAYTPKPFASALSIGVGLSIDLTELLSPDTNIDVEKYEQEPVFPVFYSWYDENHFAKVRVQNREANDITEVRTYFYLEQYMSQPKLCASVRTLKKGESVELPLKAFFNESMLSLTERVNAPARVIVEYKSLGSTRRVEVPVDVPVYHRNAMNWQDDRRAAAFVSARDPAAMWFARYVSSVVKDRFRQGVNSNVQYAAGMFEALNAFGLNYVIDPTSAYADNIGSSSIDFLQFPHQTLMYRGGDCDDISILYCSLLEAVGIDTAFVTIPGHIFMAFSSGMSEEEARQTYYDPSQLIFHQGMAWVPVEITLTKEGFSKAWRIGAKQWRDAASRGDARIYPMKDSWTVYHPVSVPGAVSRFNLPADEKTALAFDTSLDAVVEREIRDQIRDHEAAIARSDTGNTRNRLGVLYGRYGMLAAAREQFAIAAKKGSTHARVNLANVYFLEQNYRDALTEYNRVLASDSANSLALLGAARCYYELDEFNRADTLYAELGTRDAALTRNYAYLGSFFETRGRAWSLADRLVTTTWSMPPISEGPQPRKQAYVGYALTELPDEAPRIERADSGLMSALSVAPAASSEDIFDFDRETEAGREAVLPGKNDAATLRALERQLAGTTSGDDDPDESLDATPVMATSVTEEPTLPGLGAGADDPEVERALSQAAAPALAEAPVAKVVATPAAQAIVADAVQADAQTVVTDATQADAPRAAAVQVSLDTGLTDTANTSPIEAAPVDGQTQSKKTRLIIAILALAGVIALGYNRLRHNRWRDIPQRKKP